MPHHFDTQAFWDTAGAGRFIRHYKRNEVVFRQDQFADRVFYIRRGMVKLTVASTQGQHVVIGDPGAGEFFGEGCLAGQPLFTATATATTDVTILEVEKPAMLQALRDEPALSQALMPFLLSRQLQLQAQLADRLFD